MPNVAFEKHSNVTASLTISLTKDELDAQLKKELKSAQKKANLKGFRKGKAPMSALRKLMGNEMLGRIFDQEINKALFGYLEENEVDIIFSPIPAEHQPQIDVDARNLQDVDFTYDLALRPEFDLKLPEDSFDLLKLNTDESFIDERLLALRRQFAESKEVESDIKENDILTVTFTELAKVNPKKGGVTNETKLFIDSLTEELAGQLKGQDVGFTLDVDINEVEKDSTETYVQRYLLGLEKESETKIGNRFRLEVKGISRRDPAELNEEFFQKFDPTGAVTDEAALRERIATDNAAGFDQQGRGMLDYQIQQQLVEGIELDLPADFLRRVQEDGKQSYERFERGIRWMLIRTKYAKEKNLEVTEEDLRSEAATQLLAMMGGQRPEWLNDEFIDNYAARMMQDEKQRDELLYRALENKIMAALREDVTVNEVAISADEFNERISAFNELHREEEEE